MADDNNKNFERSMKDNLSNAWKSNPGFRILTIAVVIVFGLAISISIANVRKVQKDSLSGISSPASSVKDDPFEEKSKAYVEALEKDEQQRLDEAVQRGQSVLPYTGTFENKKINTVSEEDSTAGFLSLADLDKLGFGKNKDEIKKPENKVRSLFGDKFSSTSAGNNKKNPCGQKATGAVSPGDSFNRHGVNSQGYDKDGYLRDCLKESDFGADGYDQDGYDKQGYNRKGYDKAGFNKYGYDQDGYNADGLDKFGNDRSGYDQDGYDKNGYNRNGINREGKTKDGTYRDGLTEADFGPDGYAADGYDKLGYNKEGFNKSGFDRFGFDKEGYNKEGFNRNGVNKQGEKRGEESKLAYDKAGYDQFGYNKSGYDKSGYDKDGFDKNGYNRNGINREGKTKDGTYRDGLTESDFGADGYAADGYDKWGYDKNGYDKNGYDKNGYDKAGFNKAGYNRNGINREGKTKDGTYRDGLTESDFGPDGYAADGYDKWGYDKNGYDKNGLDKNGKPKKVYNEEGYDQFGYDKNGLDKNGFDKNGYDKDGYDKGGFSKTGYNRNGINREGKTKDGTYRDGLTEADFGLDGYAADGYDKWGYDKNGFDNNGLNKNGYDKDGYDKNGYDKKGFKKPDSLVKANLEAILVERAQNPGVVYTPEQKANIVQGKIEFMNAQIGALANVADPVYNNILITDIAALDPSLQGSSYTSSSSLDYGSNEALLDEDALLEDIGDKDLIVSAGSIAYAVTLTESNSEVPGPVLAKILTGPLKGFRVLGSFAMHDDYLVIQFNRAILGHEEYDIEAFALDPATTLPGMASEIDRHYVTRFVLPIAASFVEGLSSAISETKTTVTVVESSSGDAAGPIAEDKEPKNTSQEFWTAFGEAGKKVNELSEEFVDDGPTIKVYSGSEMGILFLESVYGDNDVNNY